MIDRTTRPAVLAVGGLAVVLIMMQGAGGFRVELLGPDILLAVAGFRVTRTLLAGAGDSGRLPLGEFYRRQFGLRVPLLVLTTAAVAAIALVIDPPQRAAQGALDALAGLASAGNWWTLFDTGPDWYVDRAGAVDPLGLLWLLALLVQFGLVWPLLLAALRRLLRATDARRVLVALVPVLVAIMVLAWLVGPVRAAAGAALPELALGTHVRAAEWLAGAAAAAVTVGLRDRLPDQVGRPVEALAALASVLLVAMGVAAALDPAGWLRWGGPGTAAFGAAVLLLALQVDDGGPLARALGRGFPVEVGRTAYPLLVAHLPVYWLIRAAVPEARPAALLLLGGTLTWLVALVVQDGVLTRLHERRRPWTVLLVVAGVAGVAVLAVGPVTERLRGPEPVPAGTPRVLVLGGSVAGDLATALRGSGYAVVDGSRPGCGLRPGPAATAVVARLSAHAQLPVGTTRPCGDPIPRWHDLIAATEPDAVLVDLSGDAAGHGSPAPCDPAFRALYRPLLAAAAAVWTDGAPGRPVLVADVARRVDPDDGRCVQAVIAEAEANVGALVPVDVDALLCPAGTCPLWARSGEPVHVDALHLSARALVELGPLLDAAVTAERERIRSAGRVGR